MLAQQLKPHLQFVTPDRHGRPCTLVDAYYEIGGSVIEHDSLITIFKAVLCKIKTMCSGNYRTSFQQARFFFSLTKMERQDSQR